MMPLLACRVRAKYVVPACPDTFPRDLESALGRMLVGTHVPLQCAMTKTRCECAAHSCAYCHGHARPGRVVHDRMSMSYQTLYLIPCCIVLLLYFFLLYHSSVKSYLGPLDLNSLKCTIRGCNQSSILPIQCYMLSKPLCCLSRLQSIRLLSILLQKYISPVF